MMELCIFLAGFILGGCAGIFLLAIFIGDKND